VQDVIIEPYRDSAFAETLSLLADAYSTNPINVALFGGSNEKVRDLNRAMFEVTLRYALPGEKLVARRENQILGFAQYVRSPGCRPTHDQLALVVSLLSQAIGGALTRVGEWLRAWRTHDPEEAHWHLGTVAVRPDTQGQGIGSLLIRSYCACLVESHELGYLETDRPENLSFYRKAGFSVAGELEVLGVPTWFMRRLPAA
jgi:ribosomal protein S18 acetylase RimI-like enzyme